MKLSIVFPCKDQTAKLVHNLTSVVLKFFDFSSIDYEILIVSDGSDEANQNALVKAVKDLPSKVKLISYQDKKGKGHNVKRGIEEASGDFVLFMDTDLATDLKTIYKMLPLTKDCPVIIASRHLPDSVIEGKQGFLRTMMGKVSRFIIRHKFHLEDLTDTQCGFKLIRTDVAKLLASRQIVDGFAFDVEYLYMARLNNIPIKEVSTVWTDDPDSSISHPLKTSLRFMKELNKIKRHKKAYYLTESEKKALEGAPHVN